MKYPDKNELLDFIKKLKSLNLEEYDIEDLEKIVYKGFGVIPFLQQPVPTNTKIFRSRINHKQIKFFDNFVFGNQVEYNNVSEFGIKKAVDISEFGRANEPRESVFYGSTQLMLACAEVLQNVRKSLVTVTNPLLVTVGEWKVKKQLQLAPIYFSEKVCEVRNDLANHKNSYKKKIREKFIIHDILDINDLIMEFFCDEFCKDIKSHHDYKLSALYSKILKKWSMSPSAQHQNSIYNGIIYPSVAMSYVGDNISLFGENLDSIIELETAYKVLCFNFDYQLRYPRFTIMVIGQMENIDEYGNITWKEKFEQYK